VLNLTGTDLQLYKIFKIMQVSFFGTQCTSVIVDIKKGIRRKQLSTLKKRPTLHVQSFK